MWTKYDEYELLELFGSEPIYTAPEGTGMFMYSTTSSNGIKLILSLSVHEYSCTIDLGLFDEGIFEVSLDNVEYLRAESGNSLRIHQKDAVKDYIIYFKPNIFLKID